MIPGVFFLGIDADLHISGDLRKEPGVSPSADSSFKAAVPQDRSWRALQISHASSKHRLVPDAVGFCESFTIPQGSHERKSILQRYLWMNCDEMMPHLEGDVGLTSINLVLNHIQVHIAIRREKAIQSVCNVGLHPL